MKLWEKLSEEELKEIWKRCTNYKQVLLEIGYKNWSGEINTQIKNKFPWYRYENLESLIGKTFGELTVIKQADSKRGRRRWICQCSCGKITNPIDTSHLKNGHTRSCGHLYFRDLTNQKFGKLTLVKPVQNSFKGQYWLCECECGNTKIVRSDHLINQEIFDCGCERFRGETLIEQALKRNNYKYKREFSFTNLKSNLGYPLRFDFAVFSEDDELLALIEYQGLQHYKSVKFFGGEEKFKIQQENDDKKRKYCKNNNLKLIEIPYWKYNKIDSKYIKEEIEK